jgi:hypothetical protein
LATGSPVVRIGRKHLSEKQLGGAFYGHPAERATLSSPPGAPAVSGRQARRPKEATATADFADYTDLETTTNETALEKQADLSLFYYLRNLRNLRLPL